MHDSEQLIFVPFYSATANDDVIPDLNFEFFCFKFREALDSPPSDSIGTRNKEKIGDFLEELSIVDFHSKLDAKQVYIELIIIMFLGIIFEIIEIKHACLAFITDYGIKNVRNT